MASVSSFTDMSEGRLINSKFSGSSRRAVLATIFVCTTPFSFGYAIGYSSPAVAEMEWKGVMSQSSLSWFTSLLTVGALLGCAFAGYALENIGRKRTLIVTSVPLIIGWVLIATGVSTFAFLLGRTLTGVAVGMISAAAPVYISEISAKEQRGFLGSCNQLSITIGILGVYALGCSLSWDILAWIGVIVPFLSNVVIAWIPETPRWLLMKGHKAEAKQAIIWLKGPYIDVQNEMQDLEENMDSSNEKMSWSEFSKPELYMPLRVACLIMVFQQFMGINAVMFYAATIFQQAGAFTLYGDLVAVAIGVIQVLATSLSCFMMDRAGRRNLLLFAGFGMMLSCMVFALHYMNALKVITSSSYLPVFCLVVYIISFSLGWGPIPMLLSSEIFPQKARGMASSICVLTNWGCAFIVTKTFIPLVAMINYQGIFSLFAAFCFLSLIFVHKYVPETKGKSLEDIELYFLGKSLRERTV